MTELNPFDCMFEYKCTFWKEKKTVTWQFVLALRAYWCWNWLETGWLWFQSAYLHVFVLRLFQCNQGVWHDVTKVSSCFSLAPTPPKPDRLHSEVDCSISALWFNLAFPRPQASLLDLKEHASSLASSGLKKDSKLKSLEITLEQKREECTKFESQLKKVSQTIGGNWSITASKHRVSSSSKQPKTPNKPLGWLARR